MSTAETVTPNALPAVWVEMGTNQNALADSGATVKVADVPVEEPWVAVRDVVCASYKVTEAVPTPLVNVTDEG